MKKWIALSVLMLTALLAISQEDSLALESTKDFPKLILLKNDSVVVFTTEQVKKMNKTFIQLDLAREEILILDSMNNTLLEYKSISDTILKRQSYQFSLMDSIVFEKNNQVIMLKNSNEIRGEQIKRLKKSRKFYLGTGLISGVLSLALIKGLFGA
jgi:hypothetical protein